MQDQLNRIEDKLDALIESRNEHNGRIVRLETHAGFIKASMAVVISLGMAAFSWILSKHHY